MANVLVPPLPESFAPPPLAPYDPGPIVPASQFSEGIQGGLEGVKANLLGAGALVAHGFGAKGIEQAALQKSAEASDRAALYANPVENIDWTSPGSIWGGFKGMLGNAIPSLALMATGGALGGVAAKLATRNMVAGVTKDFITKAAMAGAVAPDVALEAGGIYPEALKTGVENPAMRSFAGGALAASLDYAPLLAAHHYLGAAGKGGFGAILKGILKGSPVGGLLEGTQELGQGIIERASAGQDLTGPEAQSDYLNQFAGGLAPGLIFGAGVGGFHGRAAQQAQENKEVPRGTSETISGVNSGREEESQRALLLKNASEAGQINPSTMPGVRGESGNASSRLQQPTAGGVALSQASQGIAAPEVGGSGLPTSVQTAGKISPIGGFDTVQQAATARAGLDYKLNDLQQEIAATVRNRPKQEILKDIKSITEKIGSIDLALPHLLPATASSVERGAAYSAMLNEYVNLQRTTRELGSWLSTPPTLRDPLNAPVSLREEDTSKPFLADGKTKPFATNELDATKREKLATQQLKDARARLSVVSRILPMLRAPVETMGTGTPEITDVPPSIESAPTSNADGDARVAAADQEFNTNRNQVVRDYLKKQRDALTGTATHAVDLAALPSEERGAKKQDVIKDANELSKRVAWFNRAIDTLDAKLGGAKHAEFLADFEAYKEPLAANGITDPNDPRAIYVVDALNKRTARKAGERPLSTIGSVKDKNKTVELTKEILDKIDRGIQHPNAAPWAGQKARDVGPIVLPDQSIDSLFKQAGRREGGVAAEYVRQFQAASGEAPLSTGLSDSQVALVSHFSGMPEAHIRELSKPSQQKLFDTYFQQAEEQAKREEGGAYMSSTRGEDGLLSPAAKPNVPGDRSENRSVQEDINARIQPTEADIAEINDLAAKKGTKHAQDAAKTKAAKMVLLARLREERDALINSHAYRLLKRRAEVSAQMRRAGEPGLHRSESEMEAWQGVQQKRHNLEKAIFSLESAIYEIEAKSELGGKAASGGNERPFHGNMDEHEQFFREHADEMHRQAEKEAVDRLEAEWRAREELRNQGRADNKESGAKANKQYEGKTGSNTAAPPINGKFAVDGEGFVLDANGIPIQFGHQRDAGFWILRAGQFQAPNWIYQIANHPGGSGYTVQETGAREQPQSAGAVAVRDPNAPIGEANASQVREDQSQPTQTGEGPPGSEIGSGGDIQQAAPAGGEANEPVVRQQDQGIWSTKEGNVADERLFDPEYRQVLDLMAQEAGWDEVGGGIIRAPLERNQGANGEVIGRMPWLGPEWWKNRSDDARLNGADTRNAVAKALNREKLGAKQARVIKDMLDEYEHMKQDVVEEGLPPSIEVVIDDDLVAQAVIINEDAVEKLATKYENDDAAFMASIEDLIREDENAKIARSGEENSRAAGEAIQEAATTQEVVKPTFEEYLAKLEAEQARRIAAIGPVDEFAVLRNGDNNRWLMVLPNMSGEGGYRLQYFDRNGFYSHELYDTKDKAVAGAAADGFYARDDEALTNLENTYGFTRGNKASDVIRRLNAKQISPEKANEELAALGPGVDSKTGEPLGPMPVKGETEPARPALDLTQPTPEELKAKADEIAASAKAEAKAAASAEAASKKKLLKQDVARRKAQIVKERADKAAAEFTLGQEAPTTEVTSDQVAGQANLLETATAPSLTDAIKQQVAALVAPGRHAAAQQIGKLGIYKKALDLAKRAMNGEAIKPSQFDDAIAKIRDDKVENDKITGDVLAEIRALLGGRYDVSKDGMKKGQWKVFNTVTGKTERVTDTRAGAKLEAAQLNRHGTQPNIPDPIAGASARFNEGVARATVGDDSVQQAQAEQQQVPKEAPNVDDTLFSHDAVLRAYDERAARYSAIGQELRNFLHRMLGSSSDVEVQTVVQRGPAAYAGKYQAGKTNAGNVRDVITLALNAQNPASVAAHEGFHFIENRRLSGQERIIIRRALEKGTSLYNQVLARARAYDESSVAPTETNPNPVKTNIADEIAGNPKEASAYAFQFWSEGSLEAKGPIAYVFRKIAQFLAKIKNYIDGYGFKSVDDIFEAINRGEYASSEAGISFKEDAQSLVTELYSKAGITPADAELERASIQDLYRRAQAGEITQTQFMHHLSDVIDRGDIPDVTFEKVMGTTKAYAKGSWGSLKRMYLSTFATGNNIGKNSIGYKNVFDAISAYNAGKNILIENNLKLGLSLWDPLVAKSLDAKDASHFIMERTANNWRVNSAEYMLAYSKLNAKQKAMVEQANTIIPKMLDAEFESDKPAYRASLSDDDYLRWETKRAADIQRMKDEGYAPERRYGDFSVRLQLPMTGVDGVTKPVTLMYEQFETQADQENRYTELMGTDKHPGLLRGVHPDMAVEKGTRFQPEFDASLSFKQFLDMAGRYGVTLEKSERENIAKAMVLADSSRRNRIFQRKNIPGYSENGTRILAEFVTNVSNKVAYSEYGNGVQDALQGKQVTVGWDAVNSKPTMVVGEEANVWGQDGEHAGYYHGLAEKMVAAVVGPQSSSEAVRIAKTVATMSFLGGSAAFAVVQMTSIPINVMPWLYQHTSYVNAMTTAGAAFGTAVGNHGTLFHLEKLVDKTNKVSAVDSVDGLRDALIRAGKDGTTFDTELYQLAGMTRGGLMAKSRAAQKAIDVWMSGFKWSERANRVATFIAAYKVGMKDKNLAGDVLYKFAQQAVTDTQVRYDAANRPAVIRNPIFALLFMFKTYPIAMGELLVNLYKEKPMAAVAMLGSLALFAGVNGMPFRENLEDFIDTIAQRFFNRPFNSDRWIRNHLKNASEAITGTDMSGLILNGLINSATDVSAQSRVGLHNLIPGTRIGAMDTDWTRELVSALGPLASQVSGLAKGVGDITKAPTDWHSFVKAVRDGGPSAMQSWIKSEEQFHGYSLDGKGQRLVETSPFNAVLQFGGFSSATQADISNKDRIDKQTMTMYNQIRNDFMHQVTNAIRDGDNAKVAETFAAIDSWNKDYPEQSIQLNPAAMRRAIQQAGLPLNQRTLQRLPLRLRSSSFSAQEMATP